MSRVVFLVSILSWFCSHERLSGYALNPQGGEGMPHLMLMMPEASGAVISFSAQDSIPWLPNPTGDNHSIILGADLAATIDGQPIAQGDLIGFFYEQGGALFCSNFTTWEDQATAVAIYGNDLDAGADKNGFDVGEPIQVRLYRTATSEEFAATATYAAPSPPISDTSLFVTDGISRMLTIMASSNDILNPDCAAIEAAATITADTCSASTGAVAINGINAGVAFAVVWGNGEQGGSVEGLPSGAFEASISTDNGCELPLVFDIPAVDCPLLQSDGTSNGQSEGAEGCLPLNVTFENTSTAEVGIVSYFWDFGDGNTSDQPSPSHTYDQPGTYMVMFTVADIYRTDSRMFEITVYDLPTADWGYQGDVCHPNEVSFTVSSSDDIQVWEWNFSDGAASTEMSPAIAFGLLDTVLTGSLRVQDGNGCVRDIALEVEIGAAYDLAVEPAAVAQPACAEDNGSISLSVTGGAAPYAYLWLHNSQLNEQTAEGLPSGTYSVSITDANGCAAEVAVTLLDETTVPAPMLEASIGYCEGQAEALDAGWPTGAFQWFLDGVAIPGALAPTYLPVQSGTYTVEVTNADGCVGAATTVLSIFSLPEVALEPEVELCEGEVTAIGSTPQPGYAYVWSTGSNSAMIQVSVAGTYSLSVTDANGCMQSGSTTVEAVTLPTAAISASAERLCPGDSVLLVGSGAADLLWLDTSFVIEAPNVREVSFAPPSTAIYGLIVDNGCFSDTAYVEISVVVPSVSVSPDTCIVKGRDGELSAEGAASYTWWDEGFSSELGYDARLFVSPDSTTYFFVEMTDGEGCVHLDSILVEVIDLENIDLPAVNTITPNGDGYNDVLVFPNLTKFDTYKLTVFNRNGMVVYDSLNYQNDWDGTRKGAALPDGVYFYVLRVGQLELKSTLTIIRE